MSLSIKQRWEIIFLSTHKHGPKWNNNQIAKFVKCSPHTVTHWLKTYKSTGDVQDESKSGRPSVFDEKADQIILDEVEADQEISSQSISETLNKKGYQVSARSVRNQLHKKRVQIWVSNLQTIAL